MDRISKIRSESENIADYSYIGKSYRLLSKQYGNGDLISYLYDQGRRLTSKESKNKNQSIINKYVYGYNKVNLKTYEQRAHQGNNGDIFSYDEIYRLKNIKFNSPEPTTPETTQFERQKAYQFDKVDNILKIVRQTGGETDEIVNNLDGNNLKLNQYSRFDEWGMSYDSNGNTIQKGVQQFTYDYRNQLLSAQDLNISANYKYDPFGRRVEKTIGSNTTKYFYDYNQVIEERDSNNAVIKQYIYGNGIDEILRVDKYDSGNPVPYYYHTNAIGSITAITDQNGEFVERYSYDTFGMPTITDANGDIISTSSIGNEYLFQGRRYDKTANLYYYRTRYYDTIMGRFLQTDPAGYADSMNIYQGFNMNPVNFVDPFGEDILGASSSSYNYYLYPTENEEIIKNQDRAYKLVTEGAANAALKTFLIPADYLLFPIKMATGYDYEFSLNFTEKGSIIKGGIENRSRLDIAKDQLVVFPAADAVTQVGSDIYFGFIYQGGESTLGKSSRENLARSGGATWFNVLFWGGVGKSIRGEPANYVEKQSVQKIRTKRVPNPYGKKGGPLHQGKIKEIVDSLIEKGYEVDVEAHIKIQNGFKKRRFADIIVENPVTGESWLIQVGKKTKKGLPVSREIKAIKDLEAEGWRVEFIPYNEL